MKRRMVPSAESARVRIEHDHGPRALDSRHCRGSVIFTTSGSERRKEAFVVSLRPAIPADWGPLAGNETSPIDFSIFLRSSVSEWRGPSYLADEKLFLSSAWREVGGAERLLIFSGELDNLPGIGFAPQTASMSL